MKSSLLLLGAMAAHVLAAPASSHDYIVHERRDALPASWSEEKRLDGSASLPMRIGLTQSNLDRGHDLLMDVSHPGSSRYGQFYTPEEIHDLFAPTKETVDSVRDWLENMGIAGHRISQSVNKQWLQFDADAEEMESLLRTKYYVYEHQDTGKNHVACREYHVPKHVQRHIDFIKPGVNLLEVSNVKRANETDESGVQKRSTVTPQGLLPPILRTLGLPLAELLGNLLGLCDVAITPPCIEAMYNLTKGDKATKGNELGIFEDLGDIYNQDDLDLFFSSVYPTIPDGTHPELKAVDGAKAPSNSSLDAGAESNLDFQISYPIIWPQNSILFQTDDLVYEKNYTYDGFLNNFLDAIDGSYCSETSHLDPPYPHDVKGGYKGKLQCGVYKPTNVISISYGGTEASLPISYQRRQCNEFMKLGMQGVSVVVASGDSGVEGRGGDPRPSNCMGEDDKVFAPDFPATCPYLTTTGGTYLPPFADPKKDQEEAVTKFPSGGGFSNIYKRADYQKKAVEEYFSKYDPGHKSYKSVDNSSFGDNGGIYNRIGRAYPDVAAVADNVLVFSGGVPSLVSGTSAAAPVFAAILTRINEERLAKGKSTVGFVNPLLYEHPEVFNDIVKGENSGCGVTAFKAVPGWDPVTGLGTPNYPKLLDLFMDQP